MMKDIEVAVDSGQLLVVDPCYLLDHGMSEELYDEICQAKHGEDMCGGVIENKYIGTLGFVTGTGYGDGRYRVFVKHVEDKDWGRRVAEIKIVFIEEDE
jgi:hypothetical protein